MFVRKFCETMIRSQPKVKTPRDKKYLDYVSSKPCCVCGFIAPDGCVKISIAHHSSTGGMSLKGSDYHAIPLCGHCHDRMNNATKKGLGIFEEGQLAAIIKQLNEQYTLLTGKVIKEG